MVNSAAYQSPDDIRSLVTLVPLGTLKLRACRLVRSFHQSGRGSPFALRQSVASG